MGLLSLILGSENKRNLRQVTKIANRVEELAQSISRCPTTSSRWSRPPQGELEAAKPDSLLFDAFAP